jgi:hypothetical protein
VCCKMVRRARSDESEEGKALAAAFARSLIPKYTGLRLDLDRYLNYYNTDRAHTGRWTKGRTPEEVIGKGEDVVSLERMCRQISVRTP